MIAEEFGAVIDFPVAVQIESEQAVRASPIGFLGITVSVEVEMRAVLAVGDVEAFAVQIDDQRIVLCVLGIVPVREQKINYDRRDFL